MAYVFDTAAQIERIQKAGVGCPAWPTTSSQIPLFAPRRPAGPGY